MPSRPQSILAAVCCWRWESRGSPLLTAGLFPQRGNPSVLLLPCPNSLSSQKGRDPGDVRTVLLRAAPLAKSHCHSVRVVSLCPPAASVTLQVGGVSRVPFHPPPPPAHSLGKPPGFALKDQVVVKAFPCIWQRAARGRCSAEKPGLPGSPTPPWGVGAATAQERQGSGRMASPRGEQLDNDNRRKVKDLVPALPVFVHG